MEGLKFKNQACEMPKCDAPTAKQRGRISSCKNLWPSDEKVLLRAMGWCYDKLVVNLYELQQLIYGILLYSFSIPLQEEPGRFQPASGWVTVQSKGLFYAEHLVT